jgi:transforming growth factor-beta-induced protein
VDDFEAYNGDLGDTWKDGWAKNSGIKDGDTGTHTIDTTVAEGGAQSMLLSYDNSKQPYIVEVERSISSRKNWTNNGVTKLVLSFLGDPGNSPRDRLYVKINGKQVYYGGDISSPWWKSWSIKLSSLGINVTSINEITVGVGDIPLPAGGKGKLYIDNIRLYKAAPSTPDIVDVVLGLNGDGQFDTLIAALQAADPALLEELSSEGAYTVFAPTDDAFDALGITADNVGSVDEAVLNDVLLYHVAAGTLLAADLPADVAVLEGSPLTQADGVLTDDTGGQATVTEADVVASNGVVHVIDAVLLPYNLVTVADLLAQVNAEGDLAGQFDTLLAALDVADASVAAALADDDQNTLFAPTDDVLAAFGLDPNTVADPNLHDPALVTQILLTHVGVGRLLAADLPAEIATLEGSTLAQAGGVLTDDTGAQATVTTADLEAINGVIHVIDALLLPYNLVDIVELITMLNSEGDLAGQLDVLVAGINADALVLETLTGMDQHTVFAPTDDAFAAIDVTVETVAELDPNLVTAVLLYHVAGGRLLADDVLASAEIVMLDGGSVMQADGILTDNVGGTAALIATDGEALNGVVHVIDAVLAPVPLVEPEPEPEPVDPNTVPRPWQM